MADEDIRHRSVFYWIGTFLAQQVSVASTSPANLWKELIGTLIVLLEKQVPKMMNFSSAQAAFESLKTAIALRDDGRLSNDLLPEAAATGNEEEIFKFVLLALFHVSIMVPEQVSEAEKELAQMGLDEVLADMLSNLEHAEPGTWWQAPRKRSFEEFSSSDGFSPDAGYRARNSIANAVLSTPRNSIAGGRLSSFLPERSGSGSPLNAALYSASASRGRFEQLRKELRIQRQKVLELEEALELANFQLSEAKTSNNELMDANSRLSNHLKLLEHSASTNDHLIKAQKKEIEEFAQLVSEKQLQLDNLLFRGDKYKAQVEQLELSLELANKRISQMERDHSERAMRIKDLNDDLSSKTRMNNSLEKKAESLYSMLSSKASELDEITSVLEGERQQRRTLLSDMEEMQLRLEGELEQAKLGNRKLAQEHEEVVKQFEADLAASLEKAAKADKEVAQMRNELENTIDENNHIKKCLVKDLEEAQNKLAATEADLEHKRNELESTLAEHDRLKSIHKRLEDDLEVASEKTAAAEDLSAKLKDELENAKIHHQEEVEHIRAAHQLLEKEFRDKEEKARQDKAASKEAVDKTYAMFNEVMKKYSLLDAENSQLRQDKMMAERKVEKLIAEREGLEKEICDLANLKNGYDEEAANLRQEVDESNEALRKLESEMRRQQAEWSKASESMSEKIRKLEQENEALQDRLDENERTFILTEKPSILSADNGVLQEIAEDPFLNGGDDEDAGVMFSSSLIDNAVDPTVSVFSDTASVSSLSVRNMDPICASTPRPNPSISSSTCRNFDRPEHAWTTDKDRIEELRRRNTNVHPAMRSSYFTEVGSYQSPSANEKALKGEGKENLSSLSAAELRPKKKSKIRQSISSLKNFGRHQN